MATSVTATALVRVAGGAVWNVWRDLPTWSRWQPETIEARWLAGEPWAGGSRFALRRRGPFPLLARLPGAEARRFDGLVLSTAEEQLLVWELAPTTFAWFGPTLVQSVRLEPAPGGTKVHLTLTAHGFGPTLLGFALPRSLQGQAEATLAGLRHHLLPIERRL